MYGYLSTFWEHPCKYFFNDFNGSLAAYPTYYYKYITIFIYKPLRALGRTCTAYAYTRYGSVYSAQGRIFSDVSCRVG